ncbi:MAG: hypothetical protein ABWK53_09900 [Anaerolineales bacterium]
MDTFQEPASYSPPPPPPPPPPPRSRGKIWLGIGLGLIALCFCCAVAAIGLYAARNQIPAIGQLFPTPTPPGLLYNNPAAGFSLWYPQGWVYEEDREDGGYFIVFASSQQVLDNSDSTPRNGAALIIFAGVLSTSDLPSNVSPNSPLQVLEHVSDLLMGNDRTLMEEPRLLTLDSYPAASGIYATTGTSNTIAVTYVTIVLRNQDVMVLVGLCEDVSWPQYRYPLQAMVQSINFTP